MSQSRGIAKEVNTFSSETDNLTGFKRNKNRFFHLHLVKS